MAPILYLSSSSVVLGHPLGPSPPVHLETLHKYTITIVSRTAIRGRVAGYLSLWVNEFPLSASIYWLIRAACRLNNL